MHEARATSANLADPGLWARPDRLDVLDRLLLDAPLSWSAEPVTEWFPEGGRGFWSLVRYEDVVTASKDQETFSSAHGTEIVDMEPAMQHIFGGMLNMSGDEHARHRAIVNRVLTPRSVLALSDAIRAHARRCILRVVERGSADFMVDIVGDFPAQIICELLDVPVDDRPRLIELANAALARYGTAESYAAVLEIIDYALGLVADVRRRGVRAEGGFLDRLIGAEVDGEALTDHEIGVFFALLATAGIETTTTTIGQGMRALSLHPEVRKEWQEDYDGLVGRVTEEMIRWTSPVMHFRRTATRDVVLHGQTIKAGDKVVLWYVAANRDRSRFPDPDRLDIHRENSAHVGFGGGGPHFCLGAVLARKEIEIFFRELFELLPDIEVDGEPEHLHSNFVNGLVRLPVRFTPRRPAGEAQ
jgi:cytochrome P450